MSWRLAVVSVAAAALPACTSTVGPLAAEGGAAVLIWTAPTTNADGSALVDLAGYKVHYGSSSGVYSTHEDIGMPSCQPVTDHTECTYTVRGFATGTYYFAVSAYNEAALEGAASAEATKTF